MKMHLMNILNNLGATDNESKDLVAYFEDETVSFSAVRSKLDELRSGKVDNIGSTN